MRFSPDLHYDAPQEWLIAGMPSVYRGHAGFREWFAELREGWEILDHTPLEVVDAGDVVAFLCKIRLRARASGIELDSRLGQVFWLEHGLIAREHDFAEWGDALRLIGVTETTASSSGTRKPVLISRTPWASTGNMIPLSATGARRVPNRCGTE